MNQTTELFVGLTRDHADMTECHPGCGHFSCSCGLYWDEAAEGYFFPEDDLSDPLVWEAA